MAAVAAGNQDTLTAVKPDGLTASEIALDFLVDGADRQHLAMLINGPGHGDALFEGQT